MIKKHKERRISRLPKKRRIFEHESGPVVDALYMRHKIYSYEINEATIGQNAPEHLRGKKVEVLFFSRTQCEVQPLNQEEPSFFIPTSYIDFTPIQKPHFNHIVEGQYIQLKKDIKSDDQLRGILGEEGEELLVIKIEPREEYPYWVYNEEKQEAFRVKREEFTPLDKRILIEIL